MKFHHLLFLCVWLAVLLSTVAAIPAGRQRRQISLAAAAVRGWPVQYYRRAYLSSSDSNQRHRVRFLIRPDSEWAGGRNWWTRKRFENGQSSDKANFIFYS
ncbi:uncharacterized protein LOC124207160 isoform X2 [Daphnia pulex]|uniref:uncharacterized protein LOC124207160 isoform X2 n=1 Tax=Daphnia pulex TaxID=6669 RepID=UPI001EE0A3E2|nr:uncharacterized protein LOC124207160 isoform X2 [Daphnia pulex]